MEDVTGIVTDSTSDDGNNKVRKIPVSQISVKDLNGNVLNKNHQLKKYIFFETMASLARLCGMKEDEQKAIHKSVEAYDELSDSEQDYLAFRNKVNGDHEAIQDALNVLYNLQD